MAINGAFQPQGRTFLVTTNATPSTASAQVVSFNPVLASQPTAQATGLSFMPLQMRVVSDAANTGIVFVNLTTVTVTAAAPGANPSFQYPILPNEDMVVTNRDTPAADYTVRINTISPIASQKLYVTFGEGQ